VDINKANKVVRDLNKILVKKRTLQLSVIVENEEEAEEIIRWMYAKADRPMKSQLDQIAWDKVLVNKDIAEFMQKIKEGE